MHNINSFSHLLEGIHTLGEHTVSHHYHQDGHSGVHHCQGAMLQLPGLDALTVHVGQLLDLESSLQTCGKIETSTHDEQRLLLVELLGDIQHLLVKLENLFDLLRKLPEAINDLSPPGLE